jgi:hypothetical protein
MDFEYAINVGWVALSNRIFHLLENLLQFRGFCDIIYNSVN